MSIENKGKKGCSVAAVSLFDRGKRGFEKITASSIQTPKPAKRSPKAH
jgi:hypothetical protein